MIQTVITEFTAFERLTYEGRQISDRRYLGGGYCGSISLEGHIEQLADPGSWVHSSTTDWLREVMGLNQVLVQGAGI